MALAIANIYAFDASYIWSNRLWCGRYCCYGCFWHWMSAFFIVMIIAMVCAVFIKTYIFPAAWCLLCLRIQNTASLFHAKQICSCTSSSCIVPKLQPVPQIKVCVCVYMKRLYNFSFLYAHGSHIYIFFIEWYWLYNGLLHFPSPEYFSFPFCVTRFSVDSIVRGRETESEKKLQFILWRFFSVLLLLLLLVLLFALLCWLNKKRMMKWWRKTVLLYCYLVEEFWCFYLACAASSHYYVFTFCQIIDIHIYLLNICLIIIIIPVESGRCLEKGRKYDASPK